MRSIPQQIDFKGLTQIVTHFRVFEFGSSVKDYAERGKGNQFPRREKCPHCQRQDKVIWYGFYSRWCHQVTIVIKRYFCKHCLKTFSLMPSFLCHRISETVEVVERILWQIDQGKSYRESREAVGRPELSYQRVQYWRKRWQKKITQIRVVLPLKDMQKTLDIFEHLSSFFGLPQGSGRLFEAANRYFSLNLNLTLL
jgi:transposase-like protein